MVLWCLVGCKEQVWWNNRYNDVKVRQGISNFFWCEVWQEEIQRENCFGDRGQYNWGEEVKLQSGAGLGGGGWEEAPWRSV